MALHDGLPARLIVCSKFDYVNTISDNTLHLDYIRIWLHNLCSSITIGKRKIDNMEAIHFLLYVIKIGNKNK